MKLPLLLFVANDTGSAASNIVQLTEAATTITEGLSITIDGNENTAYDGGNVAFNVQATTFQISAPFDGIQTGNWTSTPINQTDRRVLASNNARLY